MSNDPIFMMTKERRHWAQQQTTRTTEEERLLWEQYWECDLTPDEIVMRDGAEHDTAETVRQRLYHYGIPRRPDDAVLLPRIRRPTMDDIWMRTADLVAERSHHPETRVGCVIVSADKRRVLSIGYAGNARGLANEPDSARAGESGTIHAEVNALVTAGEYGTQRQLYTTVSPCLTCAKLIINVGIAGVCYRNLYRDVFPLLLLKRAGISTRQYKE